MVGLCCPCLAIGRVFHGAVPRRLQSVSATLVEAARIDGAGRWGVFKHVTMPALKPTLTIVLVLSIINSLKAFDIVYGMTGGGPAQQTQMLAMWAYGQAMQLGSFGRGRRSLSSCC